MHIELSPVAFVRNTRTEVIDDNWGAIISEIQLAEGIPEEAFDGITSFSHLHIIFYMDKVKDEKAIAQSRHPRNDVYLPRVGTYAQRNKNRPNKLGLSTVQLISRAGRTIRVKYLDAIDGTPILDIKPVMKNFQPKGTIREPHWTSDILKQYW